MGDDGGPLAVPAYDAEGAVQVDVRLGGQEALLLLPASERIHEVARRNRFDVVHQRGRREEVQVPLGQPGFPLLLHLLQGLAPHLSHVLCHVLLDLPTPAPDGAKWGRRFGDEARPQLLLLLVLLLNLRHHCGLLELWHRCCLLLDLQLLHHWHRRNLACSGLRLWSSLFFRSPRVNWAGCRSIALVLWTATFDPREGNLLQVRLHYHAGASA
mmetsp:Transcript_19010/g.57210  ORF Transcript_19010/g.57210 Transcript_19010/m.57210 type:complete len:213 (+) Transcript_19010:676-1314(+)